jgi:hypothetical protein
VRFVKKRVKRTAVTDRRQGAVACIVHGPIVIFFKLHRPHSDRWTTLLLYADAIAQSISDGHMPLRGSHRPSLCFYKYNDGEKDLPFLGYIHVAIIAQTHTHC